MPSDVVVGDVVDETAVADAMRGCDAVFHAAALVDLRRKLAQRVLDTNKAGVERVIGGAAKRGLPSIVYVSSMSVFFQPGPVITPESPIVDATTAYGRSKVEAERVVRRLQESGAPIRISYPCGIVGPDDPGMSDGNRALWTWIALLFADMPGGFQPVDVSDVAALHVVISTTHCFGRTLMDTLTRDNVNPIAKVEHTQLIVASHVFGRPAGTLVADQHAARLKQTSPSLFLN